VNQATPGNLLMKSINKVNASYAIHCVVLANCETSLIVFHVGILARDIKIYHRNASVILIMGIIIPQQKCNANNATLSVKLAQ